MLGCLRILNLRFFYSYTYTNWLQITKWRYILALWNLAIIWIVRLHFVLLLIFHYPFCIARVVWHGYPWAIANSVVLIILWNVLIMVSDIILKQVSSYILKSSWSLLILVIKTRIHTSSLLCVVLLISLVCIVRMLPLHELINRHVSSAIVITSTLYIQRILIVVYMLYFLLLSIS